MGRTQEEEERDDEREAFEEAVVSPLLRIAAALERIADAFDRMAERGLTR